MHGVLAVQDSAPATRDHALNPQTPATHLGAALAADGGADQLDGVRDAPRDLLVPPLGALRTVRLPLTGGAKNRACCWRLFTEVEKDAMGPHSSIGIRP